MNKEWICMILIWKLSKLITFSEDSRHCFPLKLINYWKSAEFLTCICSLLIFFCLLCHFPLCVLELCFNYIAFIIVEFINLLFLGLPLSLFLLTFRWFHLFSYNTNFNVFIRLLFFAISPIHLFWSWQICNNCKH